MKLEDVKIGMEVIVDKSAHEQVCFSKDKLGLNIVREVNDLIFFEGHNQCCQIRHIRKLSKLEKAMR